MALHAAVQPMRILFATAEMAPWVKTGGLGDVAAALPPALARAGCELRVLLPRYPALARAFPEATELLQLPALAPGLPACSVLQTDEISPGVVLWLLDMPDFFAREGNPYTDPNGDEWPDNVWRYGLLSRVAAWLAENREATQWPVDVLHGHDWHVALASAYRRYLGGHTPHVMTVHNLAFQGLFGHHTLAGLGLPESAFRFNGVEFHGKLSFLKAGLQSCDSITTVSPTYAREIQTAEYGCGLEGLLRYRSERLVGILNGVDQDTWNPATDTFIDTRYDADSMARKSANSRALRNELGLQQAEVPLLGVVSRMGHQKGSDLLLDVGDRLIGMGAQLAVLGAGDKAVEAGFGALAERHPRHVAVQIGYSERLAHAIEAGSDIFLMPSRFEPCGLNQMYSLRYGTPPVVRRTGGLTDTVVDANSTTLANGSANGFVFDEPDAESLLEAVSRALALRGADAAAWCQLQRKGMLQNFGWEAAAQRYRALYATLHG
jgi:starch synthase